MRNWKREYILLPLTLCLLPMPGLAQITPDATLPNNSIVTPLPDNTIEITGGTEVDSNLFHSFQEFSVDPGSTAYFNNAVEIRNIFSRVTGGSISNIDGMIGANGSANLFVINPNGIIFGPNAQLDIGGSFLGTTAESINFADGTQFSATNPQAPPLLTINVPIGLQFGAMPREIVVEGSGHELTGNRELGLEILRNQPSQSLQVKTGQTLALVGGGVTLTGGNMIAESGRIELGSVGGNSIVNLNQTDSGLILGYKGVQNFQDIGLFDRSSVDASGKEGGGGDIQVQGRRVTVAGDSLILALTEGSLSGGELSVNASESVAVIATGKAVIDEATGEDVSTPSSLLAESSRLSTGDAGNLTIITGELIIQNGAQASSSSFGEGKGGALSVRASEKVELTGTRLQGEPSSLTATTEGLGQGGDLSIMTDRLILQQGANISTATFGERPAGNLTIETRELIVRDRAQISTNTFGPGDAGNMQIRASDSVELSGVNDEQFSRSGLFTSADTGNGGSLTIETRELIVRDGAQISTTTFGSGDAGNMQIRASDSVEVSGVSDAQFRSGLFAQVDLGSRGNGGNLTIETGQLRVRDGAQISTGTAGEGQGGNLTVNSSELVEVTGSSDDGSLSSVLAQVNHPIGTGDGGDLTINTRQLIIGDGAGVSAGTVGAGNGGSLTVNASESVELRGTGLSTTGEVRPSGLFARSRQFTDAPTGDAGDLTINTDRLTIADGAIATVSSELGSKNAAAGTLKVRADDIRLENGGEITAETGGGEFGNIELNSEDIRLRRGSEITTNAQTATGGNITIDTDTLVALENSDITANARAGNGGRVTIEAEGIFGTEFRDRPSPETSDITATSNLGPEFSGIVDINTPDVDPSEGVVKFDNEVVDIQALIDRDRCQISDRSQFIITGRGGLPPSPNDPLVPNFIWQDGESTGANSQQSVVDSVTSDDRIVEAQGFEVNAEGKVELVADPPKITPHSPWYQTIPGCNNRTKSLPDRAAAGKIVEKIVVKEFQVEGSSVFTEEELQEKLTNWVGKEIAFADLLEARKRITKLYTDGDYITSGAYIPLQTISDDVVKVQVVEGKLTADDIQVTTSGNLSESHVRKRLLRASKKALNSEKLVAELQLLRLEEGIKEVQAELSAGVRPGTSVLSVEITEANPLALHVILDNGRSPSVGSFRRGGSLSYANLLGTGDRLRVGYTNTQGSDTIDAGYAVPLNARNSTLALRYASGDSNVVERPFDQVDIEADSRTYELTYREPIVRKPSSEIALGLTASRRESETSLLGVDFPLSPGANDDGETRLSVLRFFQDWTGRGKKYMFATRSEFNLGVGWFDATVNSSGPDSRFFSWRGQGQWVRELANDSFLVVRGNVQLSPSDLVPLEEFGIGGLGSVRGYRQDTLLTDNGVFGSVEAWIPVVRFRQGRDGVLQLTPFVDFGAGWRSDGQANPDKNVLVSTGIGLRLRIAQRYTVRLDWGIPLVDRDSRNNTWQENGIYFSITSSPF